MGAQRFTVGLAALLLAASLSKTAIADLSSVKAAIAEGKTDTVVEELKGTSKNAFARSRWHCCCTPAS